jgi:hypothetical protein
MCTDESSVMSTDRTEYLYPSMTRFPSRLASGEIGRGKDAEIGAGGESLDQISGYGDGAVCANNAASSEALAVISGCRLGLLPNR